MRLKGEAVKGLKGGTSALLILLTLHLFNPSPLPAQTTSALPVTVVLMLPSTWAGESFTGFVYQPTNQARTLLLWPCTNCGGGGTTLVTQVTVTGITNLNGQTNASQTFVVGTGGSDFNIASSAGVHTFHLPTASATVRGALSSADWFTFNAKSNHLVQTNGVDLGSAGTANWTFGVTGYVSGGVLFLGVSSAGGGTPGGNSAAIQFNETGAFAGTNQFAYDRTNNQILVSGAAASDGDVTRPRLVFTNTSSNLSVEYNHNSISMRNLAAFLFNWGSSSGGYGTNILSLDPNRLVSGVSNQMDWGTYLVPFKTNYFVVHRAKIAIRLDADAGAGKVLTSDADGVGTWQTPTAGSGSSGGFVSGITNYGYTTTNVLIDLGATNYSVHCVTNTGGPVNLLFTNLTLGFNWTVLIDGIDLDGTTSASNALVTYVWPHANDVAQWLGFTTNTYVTSNKVLGVAGFIRRTNSVILSSRE